MTRRAAVAVLLAFALGLALGSRATATTPRPAPAPVTGWGPVVVDPGLAEAPRTSPVASPSPVVAATGVVPQPTNGPTPNVSPARLSGIASWYRYVPGQAAAGPRLRALLGNWRGRTVTVNGIPVRLTDWCQCFEGQPDERLIDLDSRTFAQLAPLSRGLVAVDIDTVA